MTRMTIAQARAIIAEAPTNPRDEPDLAHEDADEWERAAATVIAAYPDASFGEPETYAAITIADTSREVLADAGVGDRVYVVDEHGDGWKLIVMRPLVVRADGILLAQGTCDTLRVDEWSNWRTMVVDLEGPSMTWTEPEAPERPAREHVLAITVALAGWS